jgi:hypothetical protein
LPSHLRGDKERSQPYFRREFELAYSVGTGNVFTEQSIQTAEELGKRYKARTSFEGTQKSLGIDPGFGSSKTALTVIECVDDLAHVIYSKQFFFDIVEVFFHNFLVCLQ